MKADAVFEGGGIRGIAFAGAIEAMEQRGVEWVRLAGTSVGSILASLLAAGYTSKEIHAELRLLNFKLLRGKTWLNHIPLIGNVSHLFLHLGMYKNDYIEQWMNQLLSAKGIRTFADLPKDSLKIIASDISNGQMLVFPDDLPRYGLKEKDMPVAKAVMMSTSIPFFYRPAKLKAKNGRSYIVDGGLLSNFPIWIFDVPEPRFPTFGFRFLKDTIEADSIIPTPIHLAQNIVKTMLQAHDMRHLNDEAKERTLQIYTGSINATDFHLNDEQMDTLYQSGFDSANRFLEQWNFEQHKQNRKARKSSKKQDIQ
ncbi:NTE family protein [Alkalihalobacillus xiaoxiensis]|uniref:NTE family protein n=1 Tax=Shouchella xiaoxiensis TaxID=766895 RepID=A0ABS2SPE6_9BACI|nr:patatin-like phospholipase family protein [Shouchella xiaoxiensis]MBM7837385.1 NTE family protein [Shouchella xiaoxiensis]